MDAYLIETDFEDVDEKPTRADVVKAFSLDADRYWTRPVADSQPFEMHTYPGPGRIPYMILQGDY